MFFILKVKYVCMIDCVYQSNIYIEISTRKGLNIWDNELSHSEALKKNLIIIRYINYFV